MQLLVRELRKVSLESAEEPFVSLPVKPKRVALEGLACALSNGLDGKNLNGLPFNEKAAWSLKEQLLKAVQLALDASWAFQCRSIGRSPTSDTNGEAAYLDTILLSLDKEQLVPLTRQMVLLCCSFCLKPESAR